MLFNRREFYSGATWIDAEEYAYAAYSGNVHDKRNTRRAAALCADGVIRAFRIGIPDTYFSIPAIGRIKGRYVRGFISLDTSNDPSTVVFTEYAPK